MKQILPTVFVIWLLVVAQVSYAESLSAAANASSSPSPKPLEASPAAAGDASPVADDTCQTAVEASLGSWNGPHIIWPSGEVDWFKWNLPGDGRFTVDVDVPSNRDYDLAVYSSCTGSPICSSEKGKGYDEQCSVDRPGSGWVYAKVYGYNGDSGLFNTYSIRGTLARSYDLVPSLSTSPASPNSQNTISIKYGHTNNGPNTITTPFNSKLYVDNNLKVSCNQNSNVQSGSTWTCTYPTTLSAGSHTLKVVADADNSVAETNEGNNQHQTSLDVARHIDLRITDIYTVPSSPDDQGSFKIGYAVKNDGADSAPSTFLTKVYVNNAFWGSCTHNGGIGAGSSQTCELSDNKKWAAGAYTIKVVADADNGIKEYNEGNNEYQEQITVTYKSYDLVPGDFTVTPSSPKDNDAITVRYRATNNGPDDVTSSFNYKLYIDNTLQQTCLSSGSAAGTTSYCEKSGISLSVGVHTLKNVIDADNQVAETNENNNVKEEQLTVASSCPSDKPYSWGGTCNKCPQDKQKLCGSTCYGGTECGSKVPVCDKNNNVACCPSSLPFYCGRIDRCTKDSAQCNAANKCGSEDWTVCPSVNFPNWNCRSNGKSVCCQAGTPYWWNLDNTCHASPEPQKCSVPDGSSAACDCDSNSDCPSGKPYCEENYPSPISDGHDGCISAVPEYCGNGKCAGSETYSSCAADCSSLAPKGTVNVDVYYSSGSSKGKPVSGASVSLDGVPKGTTDGSGKINFVASYGSRNVKVECPDGAFCAEKSVGVDGAKSVSFGCSCNPSTDSDGDGYSNEDEKLLGTNPKDANSNFATTFGSDSVDLLACVPTPVSFFILWKEYRKGGSIIQSHSLIVNSLNVTSVMSVSFEDKPYVVAEVLAAAGFEAEGAEIVVNPVNVTLESVMKKAEYVDGVRMQDGILLVATDKDGQTTALIAIGAGCVGAFSGAVYGIGQGIFDDIKGVIDGILFVITHLDDVKKVWSGAVELVNGIKELFSKPGEAFWSMFTGILKKGQGINLFGEGRLNQPEPYRHFQVGFVYGFVTGYLVEQVALGAAIFSKVAKAFKIGQLFGKTGKVAKLMEKLAIIRGAEEFGAEVAEKLGKLKYLKEGVENWLDSEIKGLARVMKHNEGWLKGLSEAEAKVAAKHADDLVAAGKISDAAFGDLAKTKLGQHTLKASDATTDLLAKQSKLVQKWGVSKADDVVSKGGRVAERADDLNKVLKAMPDNLVGDFDSGRAVKFLGDKKLVEAAEKLTKLCGGADVGSLDYGPAAVQTCLTLFTKVDDFEDAVKGAKAVSAHIDNLDSIPKFVQDFPTKVEALADLGKLSDVTGVDKLAHDIAKVGGGHSHAARRAVILKETSDVKLLEVGKGVDVKIKYQGNEFVEKLDIDVFYERNIGGKKIRVMEEVKSKESGVIGASEEVQKDVLKMTKALEMGLADEAKIVTKGTFDVDVTRFIEQNGNKVQLVPGGIK